MLSIKINKEHSRDVQVFSVGITFDDECHEHIWKDFTSKAISGWMSPELTNKF